MADWASWLFILIIHSARRNTGTNGRHRQVLSLSWLFYWQTCFIYTCPGTDAKKNISTDKETKNRNRKNAKRKTNNCAFKQCLSVSAIRPVFLLMLYIIQLRLLRVSDFFLFMGVVVLLPCMYRLYLIWVTQCTFDRYQEWSCDTGIKYSFTLCSRDPAIHPRMLAGHYQ